MRKVPAVKVVAALEASESPLPAQIQEALGELVGAAREGLLALSVGVGLGVDDVIHHYKRATRELWKFCWLARAGAGVQRTARLLRDMAAEDDRVDWWQRAAPRERDRERS